MANKRASLGIKTLGELDVDVLMVMWKLGPATVKDVFENLYQSRKLAYTTIMTVMTRLANKGTLERDRTKIPYVYKPNISPEELALSIINHVIDRLLDGSHDALIKYISDARDLAESNKGSVRPVQETTHYQKYL